jgi:hypothetical protein
MNRHLGAPAGRWGALLFVGLAACSIGGDKRLGELDGARLGMTASMVRDGFRPMAEGAWEAKPDGALEWRAASNGAALGHARFEFHNAQLVAIRAEGEGLHGPGRESSRAVVVARKPGSIVILARDCPEHAREVEALLARSR